MYFIFLVLGVLRQACCKHHGQENIDFALYFGLKLKNAESRCRDEILDSQTWTHFLSACQEMGAIALMPVTVNARK
jgi:hypothetical protein